MFLDDQIPHYWGDFCGQIGSNPLLFPHVCIVGLNIDRCIKQYSDAEFKLVYARDVLLSACKRV